MKKELEYLIIIFNNPKYDWLGFKITDENILTFHHIKRKWEGGEDLVTNGALLTNLAHKYLHSIEFVCPDLYNEINDFLKEVNTRGYYPTIEELELLEEKLLNYDKRYKRRLKDKVKLKSININKLEQLCEGVSIYHPTNIRMNLRKGNNIYIDRNKVNVKKKKH